MQGKIFITRHGYDPRLGGHIKDPYLGEVPSIGACRPDFRRRLNVGDHLFLISGKVPNAKQLVLGGFEIDRKMPAIQAYHEYPNQRLRQLPDGQLAGNIIVDENGMQHGLDNHDKFDQRVQNYIIGRNPIVLETDDEIEEGRKQTMEVLQDVFKKKGDTPIEVIGRASNVNEGQIILLRDWLSSIKRKH